VEDVAGAMAAVAEPATTAPGSPGPIEEPVVAELPEPIALAPGTPPAHETSAETTPTTRGAAPPSKLTPLRKGWDSLYTSAGYDGEKLANLRAKGNEDLNSRHRGRSQVGWPIR